MTNSHHAQLSAVEFTPVRISRAATIMLHDNVVKVFPLFGPVREMEWAEGWAPEILYGRSEVEEHMIFRTKANDGYYQWIVTQFQPTLYQLEYTVSANGRVWFINVSCKTFGSSTLATITYTYVGLSPEGHQRNRQALELMFAKELNDWEEAINHYLKTGKKLKR